MKHLLFFCVAVNLFVLAVSAQGGFSGTVTEVIDGRTLIVDTSAGKIKAQLQYIETPEPEQALHRIVREHLAKLTVGKIAEIRTVAISGGTTIGRMTIGGVDLSAQMIRDGAAWHEPASTSGQSQPEASEYAHNQELARSEKRGVWSVAGLKTPWEVRAEKEQQQRHLEAARRIKRPTPVGVGEFHSDTRRPSGNHTGPIGLSRRSQMDAWVGVFAEARKEPYGVRTYSDPQGKFSAVYTSAALVDFVSPAGKERLECRAIYISTIGMNGARTGLYLIGFRAISEDYTFSRAKSRLTVLADKQAIALGGPRGFRGRGLIGAEEMFFYQTSWATLRKIGNSKKVEMRINKLTGTLSDESRDLFKQLATAVE